MFEKKGFCKIGVIVAGLLIFSFIVIGNWELADAGCKGWDGIPTITVKLPDKGESRCKKDCRKSCGKQGSHCKKECKKDCKKKCAKKEATTPCAINKAGFHQPCGKSLTISVNDIERFHGDIGPGVALGYRACQIALSQLYPGEIPPRKDQFVVSGSAKACPADPVSFITGARYGKGADNAFNGNLAFDKSVGFFSFIFASMTSGKAVKLKCKFEFPEKFKELKPKMDTNPEAKAMFFKMARCLSRQVLIAPEKEIFEVIPLSDFSWKDYKENYLK